MLAATDWNNLLILRDGQRIRINFIRTSVIRILRITDTDTDSQFSQDGCTGAIRYGIR